MHYASTNTKEQIIVEIFTFDVQDQTDDNDDKTLQSGSDCPEITTSQEIKININGLYIITKLYY